MDTVHEIYRDTIETLPPADQRRLVEIIVEGLALRELAPGERVHLVDFIETLPPGPRCFASWEEFERAFQAERDSWDR